MLIGYNNDVEYRGKEFHIQTEDLGKEMAKIESQIFHQGQILDTEIVEYDTLLDEDDEDRVNKKLKSLLSKTHKGLYKRLVAGKYDEMVGLEPLEEEEPEDVADPEEFEPGQERVPDTAQQIEEEGEEVFQQFHEKKAQKHVDLDNLKEHLENVDSDAADGADEESDPAAESEVDDAFAGVGSQLGDLSDDGDSPLDSRATIPPGSMGADDVAEVSVDESLEDTSKVERTNPGEGSRGGRGSSLAALPSTGTEAFKGCEEPDESLSIVSLVESFLED